VAVVVVITEVVVEVEGHQDREGYVNDQLVCILLILLCSLIFVVW